ncbi:exodeoxyribonuclease I [Vibrio aestuarianus]|uniref:Exodeoxyribonuclease I n=1 Tax=Vibrio aestuarianus TaxID=28171 RepID=A0ABM9FQF1_9VIBR|nr:exodeoxyribonuclease I [Vibrio aestuarianus]MDE1215087.1 exodeoxyribonuclease I [Vibrio aestuarianus]MDE1216651.1 exodeoxyribonuclease I [Vibrio aestuarianus]MDE1227920.1 exodeoxyribonuclease I [Vibrio aestuarianus]MDE1256393.1 exodeoxyribonuclease I [Vibrio aestuarianus]MDE1262204.1 exodeoxyribonuclease I [Vibrio aestuarianus]
MRQEHTPTFFFFDYETWGVSPAKDRPSQFAGVRTDMDFNIIGEPLVIYCQPPADYLPSPEAALITGITPQKAMSHGISEPEFIAKIHAELSTPNTTSLGYNSIRFDDEVTRYTCYRNFIDPYAWSWQKGNSRWDLLDVMRACHALRPEGINWPENEDGFTSFKLEHLSVANGIEHANAHDAMADVIATIELAKKVKAAQPKLFDYFFNMRHKRKLNDLVDIVNMMPLMHVSGMLGRECQYTSWIVPIAWHPTNQNAVIVVDLAKNPQPLIDLNVEELQQRLYTKRDDLAPDELPVPIKLVHLNKCPILAPAKTLTAENAEKIGIDRTVCLQNLAVIKQHPEIREKLVGLYSIEREYPANDDVDSQLYDGFFSPSDKAAMDIIRETDPVNLSALEISFSDKRIEPLLFRYRARNYPLTLSDEEQQRWAAHCREYFENRIEEYSLNLENLVHTYESDEKKIAILKSVYHYVETITR